MGRWTFLRFVQYGGGTFFDERDPLNPFVRLLLGIIPEVPSEEGSSGRELNMQGAHPAAKVRVEWEGIFREHGNALFGFIMGYVRNPSTAEELLQDVFVRALRGEHSFEGRAQPRTWLFSIARNLCLDKLRRNKHRNHASLNSPSSEDGSSIEDRTPSEQPSPEESLRFRMFLKELEIALAELPEEQREVFILREFHHKTFGEIGDLLGIGTNTAKSRMRYALEGLRRNLEHFHPRGEKP